MPPCRRSNGRTLLEDRDFFALVPPEEVASVDLGGRVGQFVVPAIGDDEVAARLKLIQVADDLGTHLLSLPIARDKRNETYRKDDELRHNHNDAETPHIKQRGCRKRHKSHRLETSAHNHRRIRPLRQPQRDKGRKAE